MALSIDGVRSWERPPVARNSDYVVSEVLAQHPPAIAQARSSQESMSVSIRFHDMRT